MSRISSYEERKRTEDLPNLVAAILTVALCSKLKARTTSQKVAADQWRNVWRDYNKFLKELEKMDESIDRRGINPD